VGVVLAKFAGLIFAVWDESAKTTKYYAPQKFGAMRYSFESPRRWTTAVTSEKFNCAEVL